MDFIKYANWLEDQAKKALEEDDTQTMQDLLIATEVANNFITFIRKWK